MSIARRRGPLFRNPDLVNSSLEQRDILLVPEAHVGLVVAAVGLESPGNGLGILLTLYSTHPH